MDDEGERRGGREKEGREREGGGGAWLEMQKEEEDGVGGPLYNTKDCREVQRPPPLIINLWTEDVWSAFWEYTKHFWEFPPK